jgi:predicted N-acetyltransferase YhbS
MMDGPRPVRAAEWEQLDDLVSTVFRPGMMANYPQLFNAENRSNLRVVAEDGKVVCHVGMTQRPAALAGCRLDVACIGAVATFDAYRGRGFASAAFQDCCDIAGTAGVDIMLISGGRNLYTRVGCRSVGWDWNFLLDLEQHVGADLHSVPTERVGDGEIAPLDAKDIPALAALYQTEPVRFLRSLEDWQRAFSCRIVMAGRSDFWGVSFASNLVAYIIVQPPRASRPDMPAHVRVVEYAGDRAAIVGALPSLLAQYGAQRLHIHVLGLDEALRVRLTRDGFVGSLSPTWGTLRVINFAQLMDRCRPFLAERIGSAATRDLRFEADERPGSATGGFTVRRDSDALRIPNLGSLATYLFARREGALPLAEGSSKVAVLMEQALPLPTLWYGVNYV